MFPSRQYARRDRRFARSVNGRNSNTRLHNRLRTCKEFLRLHGRGKKGQVVDGSTARHRTIRRAPLTRRRANRNKRRRHSRGNNRQRRGRFKPRTLSRLLRFLITPSTSTRLRRRYVRRVRKWIIRIRLGVVNCSRRTTNARGYGGHRASLRLFSPFLGGE